MVSSSRFSTRVLSLMIFGEQAKAEPPGVDTPPGDVLPSVSGVGVPPGPLVGTPPDHARPPGHDSFLSCADSKSACSPACSGDIVDQITPARGGQSPRCSSSQACSPSVPSFVSAVCGSCSKGAEARKSASALIISISLSIAVNQNPPE